jgi:hypothetical protein
MIMRKVIIETNVQNCYSRMTRLGTWRFRTFHMYTETLNNVKCAANGVLKKEMGMTEIIKCNGEKLHCNYRHLFIDGY